MGVGVLLLLTIGAYYAYSLYSLGQMGQGAVVGPAAADALAQEPGPEDEALLLSGLAGAPGEAGQAASGVLAFSGSLFQEDPAPQLSMVLPAHRIVIRSIEVDSPIVETGIVFEDGEWQWERPKNAVGHLRGTADPGQPGNIVMAGHISSPIRGEGQVFKRLPEIQLGDLVVLYTPVRALEYQVVAKQVVLPSEVNVLNPTPDETLTLITCVPDLIYSHRLVVTARRVSAR